MKNLLLISFLLLPQLAHCWEGNILCDDLKTMFEPNHKSPFLRPGTYENPIIIGGRVSSGEGPFDHFLSSLKLKPDLLKKVIHVDKQSDVILQQLNSSSDVNKASVILALDLLFADAEILKENCSAPAIKSYYSKGHLQKLLNKKIPILLGRIPFLIGLDGSDQTPAEKCAVIIDAVVNTEFCGPNKKHCFWLDVENFYAVKIKDQNYFPGKKLYPTPLASKAMGQEICRVLSEQVI